ncbi:hypothetical protein TNIN_35191 [Trichonephila inaurata madagascariensis]|uniref:Uncharacterized protein n=1 Tax=Trichonephila inaurata madagascariensis TaxID=2747483 RepID=A0A8X6IR11_9ARAC|nr:hypothetical protein TNIN_35191 [Trichonephila inaurata madagascariensis]
MLFLRVYLSRTPSTPVAEEFPVIESNSKENNAVETPSASTPPKNKKKIKKRKKKKKGSVEDFVYPKNTARPVSPSVSDPVATNNSFSDLEEDKGQVVVEEVKTAEVTKP